MLEKPDLPDSRILTRLQEQYGLGGIRLDFLPLGADVHTAVFRVLAEDQTPYFLKLRKGPFAEISGSIPQFLSALGLQAIIAPISTRSGQLWAALDDFKMILYPFIEGHNGYEQALTNRQWSAFGASLIGIHRAQVPPPLASLIPREDFSPKWRSLVSNFQALVERNTFADPVAVKMARLMKSRRAEIERLVTRGNALARALQAHPADLVLCHSDIHPGNLLLGANDALHIVDWDNPTFSPKERDLNLVGGCATWKDLHAVNLFYQGYGQTQINLTALAYYRYERIIQDIAAYGEQLLLSSAGGKDREQSLAYFSSTFEPEHEIELAFETDSLLPY